MRRLMLMGTSLGVLGAMMTPALAQRDFDRKPALYAGVSPVTINAGMSGAWYDPATPGQGFVIDVVSGRGELFVAWFTFDAGAHRWLTAQGPYVGGRAELVVFETTGGELDGPAPVTTVEAGQATLELSSCLAAEFSYQLAAKGAGRIGLVRLSPDVTCAEFSAQPSTPLFFRLHGEALSFDEDQNSADCRFELIYEIDIVDAEAGHVTYEGVHGGFISRTTLDPAGDGFQFVADVFDPDTAVTWIDPNELNLSGPGVADDGHAFWRGLTRFDGLLDAHGRGVGGWTCAGFEFEPGTGFDDNGIVARGTWFIRPISDENQASAKFSRPDRGPAAGKAARSLTVQPIMAARTKQTQ